ncbi:Metallo-dependent hydrolase [Hortaea werneckii]|nr:Metallo-dependent hydrolase [Hortaea werneckii]KAI7313327.1 Metallo-dependent hydrolase [Hortaea werneckii]
MDHQHLQSNPAKFQAQSQIQRPERLAGILNASLPNSPPGTRHHIHLDHDGRVSNISQSDHTSAPNDTADSHHINARGAIVTPSLCHPHIHLDKAFLLSHPKYAHLQLQRGDFAEAMELTGQAKAMFGREDLLERGQRLIDESVAAGVTHMRAFVEVDTGVGNKCLDAGIELKHRAEREGRCIIQICAFAQLPLFSPSKDDPYGDIIRSLISEAAARPEVDVLGSTPYVESSRAQMEQNIDWLIALSAKTQSHLDFHLDYNLDPTTAPLIHHLLRSLHSSNWTHQTAHTKTIVLGHCTRLTLFTPEEWRSLALQIREADLPISFVGLPTSDLFIMPHPAPANTLSRRTLDIPNLIADFGLNACLGVNNIGNAFTPYGSCDPVLLACLGVGVYQARTSGQAGLLFECVSSRAKEAIGLSGGQQEGGAGGLEVGRGERDLLVWGAEEVEWRTRKSVAEVVFLYDGGLGRRMVRSGRTVD